MVILEVSPTGLRRWVDYIPVELLADPTTNLETYNDLGSKAVDYLVDGVGKTAWVDYIPVVTTTGNNWRSNDTGVIPVYEAAAWSANVADYPYIAPPDLTPSYPPPDVAPGESIVLTYGEATDASAKGFVSYTEAVHGAPGAPFGAVDPAGFTGFDLREFSWAAAANTTFYLAVTDGGLEPADPGLVSISFTDDDDTVWTLDAATVQTAEGSTNSFDGEDIRYWIWTFVGETVGPVMTEAVEYELTVVFA